MKDPNPSTPSFFTQKMIGLIAGLAVLCVVGATCLVAIVAWFLIDRANDDRLAIERQLMQFKSDYATLSERSQSEKAELEGKLAIAATKVTAANLKLATLETQLANAKTGELAATKQLLALKKEIASNPTPVEKKAPVIANARVTRENYKKINASLTLKDVEKILGPGVEDSRSTESFNMHWRSGPGVGATIIRVTFRLVLFQDPVVDFASVSGK